MSLLIVLVHLLSVFTIGNEAVVRLGGSGWRSVFEQGDFLRLFTSMFIHVGFLHLINNCVFGFVWIRAVEHQVGSGQTAAWYLVTGLVAGLVSCLFQDVLSAGSSGALFGMTGMVFGLKARRAPSFSDFLDDREIMSNAASIVIFSWIGYDVFDHYAHVGGLATGFLAGRFLVRLDD
jgi:rhomboid protease GluP